MAEGAVMESEKADRIDEEGVPQTGWGVGPRMGRVGLQVECVIGKGLKWNPFG